MARVLIVDDSVLARHTLRTILTQAGHSVAAEAISGQQALEEYRKHKPDLVTMDIAMPGMSGNETVEKLIAEFPDAKIIMVSAVSERSQVFEAIKNGARHYVTKPIAAARVLTVLQQVLEDPEGDTDFLPDILGDEDGSPFAVENIAVGVFQITVFVRMRTEDAEDLRTVVHSLLYIRPIQFELVLEAGELPLEVLRMMDLMLLTLKKAGAPVHLVCHAESMKTIIRQRGWLSSEVSYL